DYKTSKLNVAAKYEFKTRMRLKNKSANSLSAENISMLDKFADGGKVAEDTPALLTVGAQYSILPSLRINAGWHHFFDVDTKQYTKDMLGDSNEYLFGAEYDICKKLEVSAGMQRTEYDLKDAVMNDISFNVSSYSVGFGFGYQVSDKVKVNAAYFQTFYDDYNKAKDANGVTNSFTRTNRVIGLGVDLKL
ncbi:MAG: porin, partial [Prevotella sp.]|nr:porin [Prevotella sp.]